MRDTAALLLCGYLLLSQHMGSDGALWWRQETKPVSKDECRAVLKRVTTRSKVRMTTWYDISPLHLEKEFGNAATPDKGTWLACWPGGTALDTPDPRDAA